MLDWVARQARRATALGCAVLVAMAVAAAVPEATAMAASPSGPCAFPVVNGVSEGTTDKAYFPGAVGVVKALMLFVDFPDAPASSAWPSQTSAYAAQLTPAASWFATSSFGKLQLVIDPVQQWFRMPKNSAEYGWGDGLSYADQRAYIADAVQAADPAVNFAGYKLFYFVPSANAAALYNGPAYVGGPDGVVADGQTIGFAVTFGQDMWAWGSKVLNHETGHTFGLPDLYAFDQPGDYWTIHRHVGGWDLMGYISGSAPDLFAWHKWKLGWLNAKQIKCRNSVGSFRQTLSPIESGGGAKAIILRTGPLTAYVVEVRAALGNDADTCSTGVLIYKVDASIGTGNGPIKVQAAHSDDPNRIEACGPLHHAPFVAGGRFIDAASGVTIKVVRSVGQKYVVKVKRTSTYQPV